MIYGQENLWFIPQIMHAPTTICKLLAIIGIMSLHVNIFWPKLILFICSIQNVYDYIVSTQR
jgi:hypothetical protein